MMMRLKLLLINRLNEFFFQLMIDVFEYRFFSVNLGKFMQLKCGMFGKCFIKVKEISQK
ncbi:hypothetical protein Hanom_Chr03g00259201 [Helianthus anomalus]